MESQNIEYKQSWKDEYLKWICGFANAQGGTLYIGIDDNENVVGVDNAKYLLDNLPNKCIQATGIVPDFENLTQKGKAYLAIHIKASDHLGSASWITDFGGVAVQHIQYLPYGEPYINQHPFGYSERFTSSDEGNAGGFSDSKAQRERFAEHYDFSATNTSIRDEETGFGYFGARYMDHELMTMWLSVDPIADKYPSLSPYSYCAWTRPTGGDEHRWIKYNIVNNPIKLVHPDGREIIIPGKTNISYSIGMSTNGLSGFQKRVVKSLNKIGQTSIGKELLTDLCDSKNKFYIEKASDSFRPENSRKAYKNQYTSDPNLKLIYDAIRSQKMDAFEGGSGGTISWTGRGEILPTTKGGQQNKITDLAHELFHAMDANHGRLDNRLVDGVERSEWQAVYNENLLRGQMGSPLRTHYKVRKTEDGRFLGGAGPSMIGSDGQPIKPSWL